MKNCIKILLISLFLALQLSCSENSNNLGNIQDRIEYLTYEYQISNDIKYIDSIKTLLNENADVFANDKLYYDYYVGKNLFVFLECDNPLGCVQFLDKVIKENGISKDSLYMVVLMRNRYAAMNALQQNDTQSANQFISHNLSITKPIVLQYEDLLPKFVAQNNEMIINTKLMGGDQLEEKVLSALYNYLSDLGRLDKELQESEIRRIQNKHPKTKELINYWITVISDSTAKNLGL